MTFSEAYAAVGTDVEVVAALLMGHVEPWMVDRLMNREMNRRHQQRREKEQSNQHAYDLRMRDQLREIRAGKIV